MIRRAAVPAAMTFLLPVLVTAGVSATSASASAPAQAPPSSVAQASTAPQKAPRAALAAHNWDNHPGRSPGSSTPVWGPSFNNPTKTGAATRRNLDRVYRMIQSTKGYSVARPSPYRGTPTNWPNTIRIALYSFSDGRVADALIRAHRRCISVRVLMNDHLSNSDVPAFGRLQRVLGHNRATRSWARRCHQGCRGSHGPLHTKMYLFSQTGRARDVTVFGSSNMTGKAAYVQWNDLFVWKDRPGLYDQFSEIFAESARDRARAGAGANATTPTASSRRCSGRSRVTTGPTTGRCKALKEVRCGVRPTGGTGYGGRTAVTIKMHAMEGERGLYIAQHIVRMRKAGCRVRVLYGLIAPRIHRTFKTGGVSVATDHLRP